MFAGQPGRLGLWVGGGDGGWVEGMVGGGGGDGVHGHCRDWECYG